MTVTYPYALPYFADRLPIVGVEWTDKRTDSISGQGSGRIWQAELAGPLWTATVELARRPSAEMKQIAALIRKLHGAQEQFFLFDPLSPYPASDPTGAVLGAANVKVASIDANRASMAFKGLPANYVLTLGDKFSITYGAAPTRYGFFEISETGQASAGGVTPSLGVYPHIPAGIGVDQDVQLIRPACRMVIMPGTHRAGRAQRHLTEGAGFTAMQK